MFKKEIFCIFLYAFSTVQSSERRLVTHDPYNPKFVPNVSPANTPTATNVRSLTREQLEKISKIAEELKNMADEMLHSNNHTSPQPLSTKIPPDQEKRDRTIANQRNEITRLLEAIDKLKRKLVKKMKPMQSTGTQTEPRDSIKVLVIEFQIQTGINDNKI